MKKRISLLIMIILLLSGCKPKEFFDPWDDLGGAGNGETGDKDDIELGEYDPDNIVNISEKQKDDKAIDYIEINFEDLKNVAEGVSYKENEVTITKGGTYLLKGSFIGSVVVDDCEDENVRLILDNVNIATENGSLNPAILIKKTDGLRIITVKDGTTNYLKDNVTDTGDEAEEAVISAKKCSLTINGSGTLNLETLGTDATAIKVKKELTIIDTKIEILATNNGIKADDLIALVNANIAINANGDGIKTDKEAESEEEANEFASSKSAGYIYIKNTSLKINSGDDGISANNGLYIDNRDEDIIDVTTNGGAPSRITEYSSDNADGKAIKTDGITYVNPENEEETDWPCGYSENYSLVILGGTFFIDSNDDAITSKGNLLISGGYYTISSGDDAIHAEYITTIKGGDIVIQKCYEGIEGASVEIYDGLINLASVDDGINAANGDLTNYDYHIYIGGGMITVDASGDGVDSNGWIEMTGGTLIIYGPTNGGNGSLDSDRGFVMKGGTLVATGSLGMVENPSKNSEQCYISINLPNYQNAQTKIEIFDENDNLLYELSPTKKYQSVIVSLDKFELNKEYKINIGTSSYEAKLSNIGTALGTNNFGGGNQGHRPPRP